MNEKEARKISLELLAKADGAYFTTIDADGFPQTRFVFNLRNKEQFLTLTSMFEPHQNDLLIYLATNTSSEKVQQIRNNPAACVYYCAPQEFHSLMLSGTIEIITDMEMKKTLWQQGWELYYPAGPTDPDYAVLKLTPIKAKGWYKEGPFAFSF